MVLCGIGFTVSGSQDLGVQPAKDGRCLMQTYVGPFQGKTGGYKPGVFILAQAVEAGDSELLAFRDRLAPPDRRTAATGLPCPVKGCTAWESHDASQYPGEGGGTVIVVSFDREAPEIPSLIFEKPQVPDEQEGMHYYRQEPRLVRFPGKIHYDVVLETADSIAPAARAAFAQFLSELVVE
jgi:hypothetical protein